MTTQRFLRKAFPATLLALSCGLAAAADSTTLAVSASVSAICTFNTTSYALAFGAIDPSGTVDKTATANVTYKCTNGTAPSSIAPASGGLSRTMSDGGSNTLAYTLSMGAMADGTGFGSGETKTVVVTGTITPTQFQNAAAASYSEDVTLDIAP